MTIPKEEIANTADRNYQESLHRIISAVNRLITYSHRPFQVISYSEKFAPGYSNKPLRLHSPLTQVINTSPARLQLAFPSHTDDLRTKTWREVSSQFHRQFTYDREPQILSVQSLDQPDQPVSLYLGRTSITEPVIPVISTIDSLSFAQQIALAGLFYLDETVIGGPDLFSMVAQNGLWVRQHSQDRFPDDVLIVPKELLPADLPDLNQIPDKTLIPISPTLPWSTMDHVKNPAYLKTLHPIGLLLYND